ncbi:MAG: alanine/glycine:cation symporter family protein [Bacteroidota bacterium]
MKVIEQALVGFSNFIWGTPILILLLGGGSFFLVYSRFIPFRFFGHAINVLRGKYDDKNDPGQINHFQALSSALAATIGVGNIAGVALAITMGGPGTLFWMWLSALVGIATKFFTCSLAIMFRGKDSSGELQGGPMYVIIEGLGKRWKPMAYFFCFAGMFGVLPIFQANQLTQVVKDIVLIPNGWASAESVSSNWVIGISLMVLVGFVSLGGIKRIGDVASKMVPAMVVLYVTSVLYIIFSNIEQVPGCFALIFNDAFTAKSVLGGAVGAIIIAGARRAAFSNEAGVGTAPMAHGAAKTNEPIREGLVAMLGPAIDTIIVCTMTGLAILISGVWQTTETDGVTLTAKAFEATIPGIGSFILVLCVVVFAITSMFSFSYYGTKCAGFVFGAKNQQYYNYFYVLTIIVGALVSLGTVISLIDSAFALMSFPTMISALILAPKVMEAAKTYFIKVDQIK